MDLSSAQALSAKAIQKELQKDYDAAFALHIQAADAFLHLVRTLNGTGNGTGVGGDAMLKNKCKEAAGKALERAEMIKKVKRDVRPVGVDGYSESE